MYARSRGFTIVEIMVVVVILGIAAAMVVPMLNQDSVRVPAAARMVNTDLLYAQNVASTRQRMVYVLFQSSGGKITGYQVATVPTNPTSADFVTSPSTLSPMVATFGSASGASGPLAYIQVASVKHDTTAITGLAFNAQGQPFYNDSGTYVPFTKTGTIQVTSLGGSSVTNITIQPVTGLTAVQ